MPDVPMLIFSAITNPRLKKAALDVGISSVSTKLELVQFAHRLFALAA